MTLDMNAYNDLVVIEYETSETIHHISRILTHVVDLNSRTNPEWDEGMQMHLTSDFERVIAEFKSLRESVRKDMKKMADTCLRMEEALEELE